MNDERKNDDGGNQDILERAIGEIRDMPTSDDVSAELIARTQSSVRNRVNELTVARAPFNHPLFRIAAVFVLAAGGLVVYFALRGKHPTQIAHSPTDTSPAALSPVSKNPDAPPVVAPRPAPDDAPRGVIRFAGTAPKPQVNSMATNAHCAKHHLGQVMDESMLVNDNGTLRNVVVWIAGGLEGKEFEPPKEPAVLDQVGCVYTPHVVTVMTGQQLLVKNSDPFLHNTHAAAAKMSNPPFNFGQPTIDGGKPMVFQAAEPMFVKCNVHPWMSAFIFVVDNPFFAVTGTDGSFKFPAELPPGEYTVAAWHEVLGEQRQRVIVEAGKPLSVEFTFRSTERADAGVGSHARAGANPTLLTLW